MPLVFVYGTLMRGGCRSFALADEEFIGAAKTLPQYRLYDCGSYPGLVEADSGVAVEGEVWRVSPACLKQLDELEGVDDGLYARGPVQLADPPIAEPTEAYFYLQEVSDLTEVGPRWSNADITPGE